MLACLSLGAPQFEGDDIATWHREMADLTDMDYTGSAAQRS